MNLPNKLTVTRMIMVPFVILFLVPIPGCGGWNEFVMSPAGRWTALILFCVASFTDFLDGQIARKRNLVTDFGKLFDPLADKMLVLGTFAAFMYIGKVHPMIFLFIMAREFLVTGLRQIAAANGTVLAASMFGKWKTCTQMAALIFLMFEQIELANGVEKAWLGTSSQVLVWLALAMTIFSGLDYFMKNKEMILADR